MAEKTNDGGPATAETKQTALMYAHDVMRNAGGDAAGGFNARILGHSKADAMANVTWGYGERLAGWRLADDMVRAGKLYAVHNFHHSHECRGHAFPYGGTFVCNECGRSSLNKDWWTIKCYPDGDAWCCVGSDFENLQASDCFAFGDTYDEAIKAYGDLMVSRAADLATRSSSMRSAG